MKISVDEHGDFELREVFNPVIFKTEDGEVLSVTMRDQGFEISTKDPTGVVVHFKVEKGFVIPLL